QALERILPAGIRVQRGDFAVQRLAVGIQADRDLRGTFADLVVGVGPHLGDRDINRFRRMDVGDNQVIFAFQFVVSALVAASFSPRLLGANALIVVIAIPALVATGCGPRLFGADALIVVI